MGKLDRCGWAERRIRRALDRRSGGRVVRWITLAPNRGKAAHRSDAAAATAVPAQDGGFLGPAANEPGWPDDAAARRRPG